MLSSYHFNSWWCLSEIMWIIRACLVEPDFAIRLLAEMLNLMFRPLYLLESIQSFMELFVSISIAAGNRCEANSMLFFQAIIYISIW